MVSVAQLSERATYCTSGWGYGGCTNYGSRWHRWGRWLCMALIIAAAIFVAICFLLPWIRRRRNQQTQNQQYPTQEYQQQQQPQYQQSYAPQQGYNDPQYNNQQSYQAEGEGANASYYHQGTDYAPPSHPPPASAAPEYAPPSGPPPVKYESHP